MLRLLSDENFHGAIVRGLLRRQPDLDIVRVQDVGLLEADDPAILAWAAADDRVVLTHDARTFAAFAFDRVNAGLPMPGVFEVKASFPIGRAIDEILLVTEGSFEGEWEGQVLYLPL